MKISKPRAILLIGAAIVSLVGYELTIVVLLVYLCVYGPGLEIKE